MASSSKREARRRGRGARRRTPPIDRIERKRTVVPVDEGVVVREVERVRRCHRGEILVEELPAEAARRLRERGFEESRITQAVRPAVPLDEVCVHIEHVVHREESGVHGYYSASRRSTFSRFARTRS